MKLGAVLVFAAACPRAAAAEIAAAYAPPPIASTWDYPLSVAWTASKAASNVFFYSVDLFDTAQADIAAAKAAGHYITCYFSAGSWEDWRPDAGEFTAAMKGNKLDGWPHERWVDTRNPGLRSIMAARIALAQQKGCMAIDPDNTDGYQNNPGFPLTRSDAIDYVQWLSSQAHARNLACGLKNNGNIIHEVVNNTEFVINEQCVQYNECALYEPYIANGKPVYHVEYTKRKPAASAWKAKACSAQGYRQFSTIIKDLDLDAYREIC